MDGDDALDEQALIQRIRERIRAQLEGAPLPPATPRAEAPVDTSAQGLDAEPAVMAGSIAVGEVLLTSFLRAAGSAVTSARKLAQRLLARPLERQTNYNLANHRLARAYRRELESLRTDHEALRLRCDAIEAAVRELGAKIGHG